MKKIIYIISLLALAISCKDSFIEEEPTYLYPISLAIRNSESLEEGILGIYSGFLGQQTNDIINFSELITDNGLLSNANNGQYSEIYNMNYSPSTAKVNRLWNGLNDIVIKANWVLSYEGKIQYDSNLTPEELAGQTQKVKNLFSEARILRAYARLVLAEYFCERFGGDNQQLGLVINNDYDPTNISAAHERSSVPDTYAAIQNDLQFAIDNMDKSTIVAKSNRMNLLAANVLMSRVALYKRDWQNTIKFANDAEPLLDSPKITESTQAVPFSNSDNGNVSSIFQVFFGANNDLGINSLFSYWGNAGQYKQFFATKEFFDIMPSTDKRKTYIYSLFDSQYDTPKPYLVKKFGLNSLFDIVLVRKAEIDFNRIEATYYSNPTKAREDLNTWVKQNRDPSYNSTSTGANILNDILTQRRIEFAFEGHRFMDLKRNDMGWTKGANYNGTKSTVGINDKEQCLPIPIVEMTVNPKMVQNPGY